MILACKLIKYQTIYNFLSVNFNLPNIKYFQTNRYISNFIYFEIRTHMKFTNL